MFASVCIITFVSANLDFDCDASFTHLDSSFITGCYIFAGKEQVKEDERVSASRIDTIKFCL